MMTHPLNRSLICAYTPYLYEHLKLRRHSVRGAHTCMHSYIRYIGHTPDPPLCLLSHPCLCQPASLLLSRQEALSFLSEQQRQQPGLNGLFQDLYGPTSIKDPVTLIVAAGEGGICQRGGPLTEWLGLVRIINLGVVDGDSSKRRATEPRHQ